VSTTHTELLHALYRLVAEGECDAAIDALFCWADKRLSGGEFGRCDDLLRTVNVDQLTPGRVDRLLEGLR